MASTENITHFDIPCGGDSLQVASYWSTVVGAAMVQPLAQLKNKARLQTAHNDALR